MLKLDRSLFWNFVLHINMLYFAIKIIQRDDVKTQKQISIILNFFFFLQREYMLANINCSELILYIRPNIKVSKLQFLLDQGESKISAIEGVDYKVNCIM